jgi:hypothetical protein
MMHGQQNIKFIIDVIYWGGRFTASQQRHSDSLYSSLRFTAIGIYVYKMDRFTAVNRLLNVRLPSFENEYIDNAVWLTRPIATTVLNTSFIAPYILFLGILWFEECPL